MRRSMGYVQIVSMYVSQNRSASLYHPPKARVPVCYTDLDLSGFTDTVPNLLCPLSLIYLVCQFVHFARGRI